MQQELQPYTALAPMRSQAIGPKELLAVVIRRRWIILGIAVPIIIVATIGTLRSADIVSASARVLVEVGQAESPTLSPARIDYNVVMSSAAQVAMSVPVAAKAAAALVDSLPALHADDPRLETLRGARGLQAALLNGVECSQVGESNILNIAYRHQSPRFTLAAVGAIMNAFIEYSIESQQNPHAIDYYNEQITTLQAEIDALMTRRAEIRARAGYTSLQANAQTGISHMLTLDQDYVRARSRREGLESKLEGMLRAIAADPDYVPASKTQENMNLVGLKSRVDEQLAKLAELRLHYTEDSEWVRRQHELIAAARADMHRERDSYLASLRIDLDEARRTENVFASAIERFRSSIDEFPDIERQVESLDMQIGTHRELLKALQLKRGEVRLKTGSDIRVSSIIPLDAPTISMRVAGGKKMLYLGLASVFALALGFISAMFVESQDHRIYDRRRAEHVLEVPVLAAISQNEPERR